MIPRRVHRCRLAVLAAALLVAGGARAAPDDAERVEDAPADVLELLPPGIRPPAERAALAWTHAVDPTRDPYVVEVVGGAGSDDASWIEVEYTVDPDLDARVKRVLAEGGVELGHVIALDPASGEVFSYVSSDPQVFPATRPYPTASLMKVVTAAAILRNQPEAATRSCRYEGSPYQFQRVNLQAPANGGRVASFGSALAVSNNQCFARMAVHDLGAEALLAEMQNAGLFEEPGARHEAGEVGPVGDDFALGHLGSGLAGSFVTPLGAARLAALLADGRRIQPHWIARVRDAHGDPLGLPEGDTPLQVWTPEVTEQLRELMVGVTTRGTARRAFTGRDGEPLLGPVRVAGKTGTLSGTNPPGRYQWFIGVAPADAPRIAIATVVVNDPPGGSSASQVAAATLREVFCDGDVCAPERVERLYERSRERTAAAERELVQALLDASELDNMPIPVAGSSLELPRRLRRQKAVGEIVLLVELDRDGGVLDVAVDRSNLPDFEEVVLTQVREWRFTPPTRRGRPVAARARLPIPIQIN